VVNKDGDMYWNQKRLANTDELFEFLKKESVKLPQPEVHIRGDQETRYEFIGKVIYTAQRAGVQKVGFITEPPDKG
jgi:biopolymer transport protein ExbD